MLSNEDSIPVQLEKESIISILNGVVGLEGGEYDPFHVSCGRVWEGGDDMRCSCHGDFRDR